MLSKKKCVPCKSGVLPFSKEDIDKFLLELGNDWNCNASGHLFKKYKFKNFMQPVEFVNKVAKISEEEGHHPALTLSWGFCAVEIWTHKINGLSENDFILAAKIEKLL